MKMEAKTVSATTGSYKKREDSKARPGSLSAIVAGAKAARKKGLIDAITVSR